MPPTGVTVARSHGEEESFRQRAAQRVSVFHIKLWTAALLIIGSSVGGTSVAAASMRCRIGEQAWSPCRMVAATPGQRWVLTWDQQRVEFVHDGTGQMMMRVGQNQAWLQVQPSWTADRSLCWGAVCAHGAIPLE
ncbi:MULTISPECIES: hypothetical protein [unclassified Synechococcus]|uniref:hypothetical protein n=1 Tax=unclassified Synechococcus TaxID=2626047 RepID=UPI001CF90230|nr:MULTISPECIES: hypothetical protein [unclassified Synechococcus]